MSEEPSIVRLYLMRASYLLNFVILGLSVWPGIVNHPATPDPVRGVALSFWAALSTLSGLGIRYPLKMVPLLFMQLFYKVVWLLAIGLPLKSAGPLDSTAAEVFNACAIGLVVDLVVIPWPYVFNHFVKEPGDRWRRRPSRAAEGI